MDIITLSQEKQEEIKTLPLIPFGKAQDLTGNVYNHLTVIGRDGTERNSAQKRLYVWCVCDCAEHNLVSVLASNLKTGKIQSCGCVRKSKAAEMVIKLNKARKLDLTGQVFGFLQVVDEDIEREINQEDRKIYWRCKCLACQREDLYSVRTDQLTSGLTTMCNQCSRYVSMGEMAILQILSQNNIIYLTEKRFPSCRFPDTNAQAKFDFYIPKENYIIEFDGEQHFRKTNFYPELKKIQEHDAYKNQWCKENNIPIIRIPYWKRNTLTLEDLQLSTSKYIVN